MEQQIQVEFTLQVPETAMVNLYEELKIIVGAGTMTTANVIIILFSLMRTVESYRGLNGTQKKMVVLKVIDKFITDRLGNTKEAQDLKLIVQTTLPVVIDTFVSIDTQDLQIKSKKCFAKMFSCCN